MKKAILIVAIIGILLTSWILAFPNQNPFKKIFPKGKTPDSPNLYPNSGSAIGSSDLVNQSPFYETETSIFPLKMGSQGQQVAWVQTGLNNYYGQALVIDGIFGQRTYQALKDTGFNADALGVEEYLEIVNAR